MVAASCWSLLQPAMAIGASALRSPACLPAPRRCSCSTGRFHTCTRSSPTRRPPEGPRVKWRRPVLFFIAITVHNIPEGLAVGVAYGGASVAAATALAIGIGVQNVPEGLAIALPLRREGMNRWKAFFYGQFSAVVEPFAGVLGAALVLTSRGALPYAMAFAAGAMLYVVVEELIPETVRSGTIDVATLGFIGGFPVMMALDNALR